MGDGYLYVGFFLVFGVTMVLLTFAANWALRPHRPEPDKYLTYECGNLPAADSSYVPVNVRYYIFALLFVLFDVEVVFFFPLALLLRAGQNLGPFFEAHGYSAAAVQTYTRSIALLAYFELAIFAGLLLVGLAYAWRKGVLKWV